MGAHCNLFKKEIEINEKKEAVKVTKTMIAKKARVLVDFDVKGTRTFNDYKRILSVCIGQPESMLDQKFRVIRNELLS